MSEFNLPKIIESDLLGPGEFVLVPLDEIERQYRLSPPNPSLARFPFAASIGKLRCVCGHTYRFHVEHWPACSGFRAESGCGLSD